jgi:flagellar hook-associated protein FlgK
MVTLVEAENAYRMNAAVIRAASDMLDTLLEAVTPRRQC